MLGLPGLIALAVTLTQTQNKVSSLEGQVNQIEGQIQRQQGFLGQTTAFSQQFGSLIDRVSKVGNTITLLGGDIANVARDAGQGILSWRGCSSPPPSPRFAPCRWTPPDTLKYKRRPWPLLFIVRGAIAAPPRLPQAA